MPWICSVKAVLEGASVSELKRLARKAGMKTLRESGLQKIREGVTTVEEVARVSAPDRDGSAYGLAEKGIEEGLA